MVILLRLLLFFDLVRDIKVTKGKQRWANTYGLAKGKMPSRVHKNNTSHKLANSKGHKAFKVASLFYCSGNHISVFPERTGSIKNMAQRRKSKQKVWGKNKKQHVKFVVVLSSRSIFLEASGMDVSEAIFKKHKDLGRGKVGSRRKAVNIFHYVADADD